jgi:hypothetical protein
MNAFVLGGTTASSHLSGVGGGNFLIKMLFWGGTAASTENKSRATIWREMTAQV